MTTGTTHWDDLVQTAKVGTSPMPVEPVTTKVPTKRRNASKPGFGPHEEIADLKNEVEYLRRQVQGLRSKLHGELAVLALRIEDIDRCAMRRRKLVRRWLTAAVLVIGLWQVPIAIFNLLNGPFLMPGLLLIGMTVAGGVAILLLILHNEADERDHKDRYANWFRFTGKDGT
jgi:hypothetical protein